MKQFIVSGTFYHDKEQPFLDFCSTVADFTIIVPLISAVRGTDIITGEDLSDLDRGMKAVFAALDILILGMALEAMKIAGLGAKEAIKKLGATLLIEKGSNAAAGTVGAAVSIKGNKLLFEDAERYFRFLENGSVESLTEAEIQGIRKVDELLTINKIDYQEILDLRKRSE